MSIEIINGQEYIPKKLIALYIDVSCYECGKLMALSNATEIDGRKYCPRCAGNNAERLNKSCAALNKGLIN